MRSWSSLTAEEQRYLNVIAQKIGEATYIQPWALLDPDKVTRLRQAATALYNAGLLIRAPTELPEKSMTIWKSLTTREQSYVNGIAQELAYDVFSMRWSRLGMNQRDALTLAVARLFRNGRLGRKLMTFGDLAPDALDGYQSAREQSIKDEQRAKNQAEFLRGQRVVIDLLKATQQLVEDYNVLNEAVRDASQA